MRYLRLALVIPVLLAVSGCSYLFGKEGVFRERAMDYQQAKSIPPLEVPGDLKSVDRHQSYPIPAVGNANFFHPKDSDDLPKPQALVNVNEDAGLELRASGDKHWLLVDRAPDTLWPQLEQFLNSNGFTVDQADRDKGILETRWLEHRHHEGEPKPGFWSRFWGFFFGSKADRRERFRFTMTSGATPQKAIVYINEVQSEKRGGDLPQPQDIVWPAKPDDPQLVDTLYNELMDFLGEGGRQVSYSVLSQDLKALPKFVMTWDGNGYPVLVINQDFNRAWLDVGDGLKNAKIPVEDLDRSLGIYYLKKDKPNDAKEKALQVRVARSENGIQVSVQYDDDTLAPKEESAHILNQLREAMQ